MGRKNRFRCAAVLFAMAAFPLVAPTMGRACGVCFDLAGFLSTHPKSIEIALATRAAIEKRVLLDESAWISTKELLGEGNERIALKRVAASRLVEAWTKKIDLAACDGPVTVHFLFISTKETCGIEIRNAEALAQTKPSVRCDVRIVTAKETLAAVLSGRITISAARESGLLIVEGDAKSLPSAALEFAKNSPISNARTIRDR